MNGTSWICRQCARQLLKPHRQLLLRHQSTASASRISSDVLYPALLDRARNVAAEYVSLSKRLESGFDVKLAKRVGELSNVALALKSWDSANSSLEELKLLLRDPSTDSELKDLAKQDLEQCADQLQQASKSLTTALVPKHPFADLPCLLEIRPGVGGSEAAIFAGNMFEMYKNYCAEHRLSVVVLSHERNPEDHLLIEAVLEVTSPGAYGKLRTEAGVHRVQRIPDTEVKGRVHTSTASVMVLPSFPEDDSASIDINDPSSIFFIDSSEIRKEYMRASGAGGQHVNKTESAVRLTHLPTKITVHIQERRSRHQNEARAWQLIRARLAQKRREAREEEALKIRRNVIGVNASGRSDKIRTYNFQQQRTTDHRSGSTVHGIDGVMSGGANLEKIMDSVRKWMTEQETENMIASADFMATEPDTSR